MKNDVYAIFASVIADLAVIGEFTHADLFNEDIAVEMMGSWGLVWLI